MRSNAFVRFSYSDSLILMNVSRQECTFTYSRVQRNLCEGEFLSLRKENIAVELINKLLWQGVKHNCRGISVHTWWTPCSCLFRMWSLSVCTLDNPVTLNGFCCVNCIYSKPSLIRTPFFPDTTIVEMVLSLSSTYKQSESTRCP